MGISNAVGVHHHRGRCYDFGPAEGDDSLLRSDLREIGVGVRCKDDAQGRLAPPAEAPLGSGSEGWCRRTGSNRHGALTPRDFECGAGGLDHGIFPVC